MYLDEVIIVSIIMIDMYIFFILSPIISIRICSLFILFIRWFYDRINCCRTTRNGSYKAFNEKEKGYKSAIHAAFRKYGIENFELMILEECPVNELDEKGKHIGTKTGEDVVLKQGTNIVSALMWRAPKKDIIDQTNPKDQKIKIDSICVHDTIFVPAAGKVKIGKYELTIEEIEKVTGSDKEQEKLKYECFKVFHFFKKIFY